MIADETSDIEDLEKAEEFETAYNFRFEEEGAARLVTHSRELATVRKDKKAEKRKQVHSMHPVVTNFYVLAFHLR